MADAGCLVTGFVTVAWFAYFVWTMRTPRLEWDQRLGWYASPPYREVLVPRWLARVWRRVWSKLLGQEIAAVTIGFTIFYLTDLITPELQRHELEHVYQAARLGRLRFWWQYAVELVRKGYRMNRFEVEARKAAGQE